MSIFVFTLVCILSIELEMIRGITFCSYDFVFGFPFELKPLTGIESLVQLAQDPMAPFFQQNQLVIKMLSSDRVRIPLGIGSNN